ncbi:hypothetical protein C8R47DRAFT_290859 [Mycena vitilis]|nr:hypothetical protein C8R47DRAFT_290859 [Mycena vitilis]
MSLWLLIVPVLVAAAGQTNHTIDDASALVSYLPGGLDGMACGGCNSTTSLDQWSLDGSKLKDGTFSVFLPPPIPFGGDTAMEFNFTGTAVYIFLAFEPISTLTPEPTAALEFFLDGVLVGTRNNIPNNSPAQYNIPAYSNSSVPNGSHTFRMGVPGPVIFDYAVYTSNDDEVVSSGTSGALPSSTTGLSSASGSEASSSSTVTPHISSGSIAQKKAPVAAIAGGVVGAIVLLFGLVVGFLLMRRTQHRNNKWRNTPSMEEESTAGLFVPVTTSPAVQEEIAAERFHVLQQQVQRLEQRVEGSSSAGSDTASLGRSLSGMKREQTRALQGSGRTITDNLVYTDSGLRLTAGRAEERVVEELPPTYVAD